MGIDVELQDERGNAWERVGDPKNVLAALLAELLEESSPWLCSIDPYGDTVFNGIQMGHFLREWPAVSAMAHSPEERTMVAAVESMAVLCRDNAHLYLKFIGD